ncbi:MAG: tyrosine-type recombinase/integrase [Fusobacterium sp.]
MTKKNEIKNDDSKFEFINEFLYELQKKLNLSVEDLEIIKALFYFKFKNFKLIPKKNELIISDNTNEKLLKKFYVCKKIENLTDRTLSAYINGLKRFIKKVNKSFLFVTTDDIRIYFATKITNNPKLTPSSLDTERRYLKTFYNFLNEEGYMNYNPVSKIKKVRGKTVERAAFTSMEIEQIRSHCRNKLETAIVETLLSTGFRNMEIVNIKLSDIDFENRQIRTIGKGNKIGYGFLNAKAILAIKDYIENERKPNQKEEDFLFLREYKNKEKTTEKFNVRNLYHEPIDKGYLGTLIRNLGKRAGVAKTHAHRFRRTVATFALKKGAGIEEVKELLRHEDIKTTVLYTQIDKTNLKAKHSIILD